MFARYELSVIILRGLFLSFVFFRVGVLSHKGLFPKGSEAVDKFSTTGPMCRYSQDLLPMLRVMAGGNAFKLNLDSPVSRPKS